MCGNVARKTVVLEGKAGVDAVEEEKKTAIEEVMREVEAPGEVKEDELGPVECIRGHTAEQFRKRYRKICRAAMEKAETGNLAELKALLYIIERLGDEETVKQRGGKSLSEMLLDELKRRQDEREAAGDAAGTEEQNTKANEADGEGVKSGRDAEQD
jgi:hypothetical protein